MKKLIGFVLLLAAAGGGWWYYVKYGTPPEQATVNELTISRGDIVEFVSATGALEPIRRYDVGSQVSGVVQRIYVDYNDIVREGQLLAEIDPQLLQVQVDIQTANVERQKGDIANQEVQLEDQKKQFERTKSLYEKGLVNQQAYETAELAIKTRDAQIASAKKSLVSVEQQLTQAKLNVSYTKIKSPANAVVVERRVDVGQTVQASMSAPSFFVLSTPLENLKLTAGVDEAEIGKIRPGMPVVFTVDAYGQKEFPGTVEAVRLNATNQNNVVTYPVFIAVPNPNLELRPSMTASVRIILSRANDVVRIPNQAIRYRPTQDHYRALGIQPPQAGQGRRIATDGAPEVNNENGNGRQGGQQGPQGQNARGGNAGREGQGGQQANAGGGRQQQGGQQAAATGNRQQQAGQGQQARGGGQQAQGQQGRGGQQGQGGGRGFNASDLTPEQRQAMMARFGGAGGGRGGGNQAGGRGANAGQTGRGGQAGQRGAAPAPPLRLGESTAQRIDELWAPIVRQATTVTVWKWDPVAKALTDVRLRVGVSDGSFSELISGEVNVGDKVVSNVVLPLSMRPTNQQQGNPLMGQPGRGGAGGMGGVGGMGGMPTGGGGGGGRGGGGR